MSAPKNILEYKIIFNSDKKMDLALKEFHSMRMNLFKESIESLGVELGYLTAKENNTRIEQQQAIYSDYLITDKYGLPSTLDIDSGIALKYSLGNAWMRSALRAGKWYQNHVNTCDGNDSIDCDILPNNDKVDDDYLGFIKTALLSLASVTKEELYGDLKDLDFSIEEFEEEGEVGKLLLKLGFLCMDVDPNYMYEMDYEGEEIEPGDIVIANGEFPNISIYWGEVDKIKFDGAAVSEWGDRTKHNFAALDWMEPNCNKHQNYGMPCPMKQDYYSIVWRYFGDKATKTGQISSGSKGKRLSGSAGDRLSNLLSFGGFGGSVITNYGGGSLSVVGDPKNLKIEARRGEIKKYGSRIGCFGQLFINGSYFCDFAERSTSSTGKMHPTNKEFKIVTKKEQGNTATGRKDWIKKGNQGNVLYQFATISKGFIPQILGTGADGIRIHEGTGPAYSEGCLIVGKNKNDRFEPADSLDAWQSIYKALLSADTATIKYI